MNIETQVYKFFADYIFLHSGIYYPEQNYYQLEARLHAIAKAKGFRDVKDLYQVCLQNIDSSLHNLIIDLATNNETSFFRDLHPFESLKELISQKIKIQGPNPLKIWSAACSSGQEPYSIAMVLKEHFPQIFEISHIWATDISKTILAKAKSGLYSQLEVQRGLPIQKLVSYFDQGERNTWTVKADLKRMIEFSEFNLLTSPYPINTYDYIFCRNVLIYQPLHHKEKILSLLFSALKDGGALFLGNAESTIGINTKFISKKIGKTIVLERPLTLAKDSTAS